MLMRSVRLMAIMLATMAGAEVGVARAQGAACSGWLAVSADKPGAAIIIDGRDSGLKTPATVKDVPCGKHRVEVRLGLYRSPARRVTVSKAGVAKLELVLKPHFGSLQVDSTPPGARVVLDDRVVGRTPLELEQVAAGKHRLRLEFPDFAPYQKQLRVLVGRRARVKVRLEPLFGKLAVSLPEGLTGRVWLDGVDVGETPLTLQRVMTGRHEVKLVVAGLPPLVKQVEVAAGKLVRVQPDLKRRLGTLLVQAGPPPVKVLVDGRERGSLPLKLLLKPGNHTVKVVGGPGTKPLTRRVKLRAGRTQRLRLRLRPATGALLIDTKPFGARVEVDGKARGRAPVSLAKLPTGVHVIVARVPGREPLVGRVEVLPGRTARVEMNLEHPARSRFDSGGDPAAVAATESAPALVAPAPAAAVTKSPSAAAPPAARSAPPPTAEKESAPAPAPAGSASPPAGEPAPAKTMVSKRRAEPAPAPESQPPAAAAPAVEARAEPMSTWRLLAWVSTGTAGATAVTMAVLFGVGAKKRSDADAAWARALDRTLPQPQRDAAYREATDLDEQADGLFLGAWISVGLTAALAGTALYLFLAEPEADAGTTVSLVPTPGGGMLGLTYTF